MDSRRGCLALVSTLVGWLFDAVAEYRRTVDADSQGHLESGPAPGTPSLMFSLLAVVMVGRHLLQIGLFPPTGQRPELARPARRRRANRGRRPRPERPEGGGPASGGGAITGDVNITAQGIAFVETSFTATADTPFTIAFANEDAGVPHNIELINGSGTTVFKGDIFNGVATRTYNVTAQPAGEYTFKCIVHPGMTGTATLQ